MDKRTELILETLDVQAEAELITLTGEASLLNVPNVNKKNDEKIVPVKRPITLGGPSVTLDLPAHSVQVLVLQLAK
ncbi:hypothetical protein D3C73_1602170 [compost metagenome]